MDVLCPDDPTHARRYENEDLNLMLRGPGKVDRIRDLFEGSERVISVASIPTSKRVVHRNG